jgi:transposase
MTTYTLLKKLLGVKDIVVEGYRLEELPGGVLKLVIRVRPTAAKQCRCSKCGRRIPRYDRPEHLRTWRALDFGGILIELEGYAPRGTCKEHGIVTMDVPWAFPDSGFTKDFDRTVAWLARTVSKSAVCEFMRISWRTVGRCIARVVDELEPDHSCRLHDLVRIGIDETSYSKGHRYITTVVNHDTNTVVWVAQGHGRMVLDSFFQSLTEEERSKIEVVSGDGARWISDAVDFWCQPDVLRCTDPFHVVSWATEALDKIRREAWQEANKEVKQRKKEVNPKRGRIASDDVKRQQYEEAKKTAKGIKNSRYAFGKAPEHLTENQAAKLELIEAENRTLFRAYQLKERLRILLKLKDPDEALAELNRWLRSAAHSRISEMVELGRKIKRHKQYILNFITTGISNARVEANNNKISLLIHRAFGFKNFQNMVSLIMLVCSDLTIQLPNRPQNNDIALQNAA